MKDIVEVTKKFKNCRIVVIGDLMLDKYVIGDAIRISPEAPVPVVEVKEQKFISGGAANVAANVSSLGAMCSLIGVLGEDSAKDILLNQLKNINVDCQGVITDSSRATTVKERIVARNQQMIRVDIEKNTEITNSQADNIIQNIKNSEFDIIIISDYSKGVITEYLMSEILKVGKRVIIDPKPKHKKFYKGAYAITPNEKEAFEMISNIAEHEPLEAGRHLRKELDTNVLITRGPNGMALFEKENEPFFIPTMAKEVYDVTGAGDTAIAAFALSIAAGCDLKTAADIANHAAGIKVGKMGTATISAEELINSISENLQ